MGMTSLSIGTMIAVALGPILYPVVDKLWRKVRAYDERRIAKEEAKRALKLAERAAKKIK